ncbi:MAG: DUF819 family protein [Clostridia bacterium]
MLQAVQVLLIFAIPMLILFAQTKYRIVKTMSPILVAYAIGIVWGNIPGIPLDRGLSMTISEISVPIAIPLILFSADFIKWMKSAKKTIVSFLLVILSAFLSALLAAWIFRGSISEFAKISGMMVGVYTGGTPNLVAIGMGLKASQDNIVLVNACDQILGGAYFLLLISVIKPVLSKILKPYKGMNLDEAPEENPVTFGSMVSAEKWKAVGKVVLMVLACIGGLGISAGIALLFTGELNAAIVMLGVTSLGVGLSFVKKIKEIRFTFDAGQYIILAFSLALGTTVDIKEMLKASPEILGFVAVSMFGAIIIHLIFAKIFDIDVDTAIITSTAGIYGPAFIIPVSNAIKNKEVIVAGLTSGLVGYAVGNYLGFLVYAIAKLL